ncbi:MAG: nucleotidyltransferase family protein [Xanthobacteraceae bacterium]
MPRQTDPPSAYSLICTLLAARGDRDDAKDAGERVLRPWCAGCPDDFWEQLANEAEYHGVTPLLAPMIVTCGPTSGVIPDRARRIFFALSSRHRRATAAREVSIDRLLTAFGAAGVPMLLLKGAALAHSLYARPELRAAADIDILVDPADERRAVDLVRGLGYRFANRQGPMLSRRFHHLPAATMQQSGFVVALEIHRDAMSRDQPDSLTLRSLTTRPQVVVRGARPPGLALGHVDMLRHLSRHAFEPAYRVRLIHLYDLWIYRARFRHVIDWRALATRYPHVVTTLRLVDQVFARPLGGNTETTTSAAPSGVGAGMLPLSQIAASDMGLMAKLRALLDPPAWWLHGFYGVPPGSSLWACRAVRHPATVVRWLARRVLVRGRFENPGGLS